MDRKKHSKTVPIRKRTVGENSSTHSSSDVEDTFIPLNPADTGLIFINPRFAEEEDEELVEVRIQNEENPPLLLLFPDLEDKDRVKLASCTSTTQIAQVLVGKKANFSLLRPLKKLNPEEGKLSPVREDDEMSGTSSFS